MNRKERLEYIKHELELLEMDFEDLSDRVMSLKDFVKNMLEPKTIPTTVNKVRQFKVNSNS